MRQPVVRVRGLEKAFGGRSVIEGLDLEIQEAEIVALVGQSGCGKSTLLRVLARQDRGVSGQVDVPDRCAVVYQEPRLLPWRRVEQNVVIGLRRSGATARTALAEVGLLDRATAWPNQLSGGEAARVALARALVRQPDLLLLDEPFAALDALTRIRMHALLMGLWQRHRPAVLIVTHDVDEAVKLADRVLVMAEGRIRDAVHVESGHPRLRHDPVLLAVRERVLGLLGVEDAA